MTKTSAKQHHFEQFERQNNVQGSSERSFGLVFSAFFAIIALLKHWPNITQAYYWFLASAILLIVSFSCPKLLKPFNKLWFYFGLLLHRIMNPIVMGALFFGILTPMGWIARLFKWDPLCVRCHSSAKSYWILRETNKSDLKNQF